MSKLLIKKILKAVGTITVRTAFSKDIASKKKLGALVQLVRIHACHAWGHGFESRTHRFFERYCKQEKTWCVSSVG